MNRKLLFTLIALAMIALVPRTVVAQQPAAPQPAPIVVQETEIDRQVREIASRLRCVVCQGLSLQDSPSPYAQEMRGAIRDKLEEGLTPAQVEVYFLERYGEWVLMKPKPTGFNLLVYVMPIAMLVGGAGFVFFQAKKWTRQSPAAPGEEHAEDEQLTTGR